MNIDEIVSRELVLPVMPFAIKDDTSDDPLTAKLWWNYLPEVDELVCSAAFVPPNSSTVHARANIKPQAILSAFDVMEEVHSFEKHVVFSLKVAMWKADSCKDYWLPVEIRQ